MHIVVIGAGEVGTHIVETLVEGGHEVALIERDEQLAADAGERLDALVLEGNGASPETLRAASVERASLVVAVTDNDDSNLIACLAARSMAGDHLRTVARVRDLTYFGPHSAMMHGELGIDLVISPDRTTADDIADALQLPGAATVEQFADGRLVVGEVIAHRSSPALDRTFADLREKDGHVIAGFLRGGRLSIAYDEECALEGDHLFVLSPRDDAARTVAYLSGSAREVRRVMVYGATKVGMHLSRRLAREGKVVTLLESDRARADFAASRLDDVLVLRARGTDRDTLVEEGIDDIDGFVSCADDDAANLLAALTARQLGASTAYAIISRNEYLPLAEAMSVDAAFSPRLHTADAILRFVRRGDVERLHHFTGGAEMLEFRPASTSAAVGPELRDLPLPRECVVSALVRGEDVIYPRGEHRIEAGDSVIVLSQASALGAVEQLFES